MAVVATIDAGGAVERATLSRRARLPPADRPAARRVAYAAAHVVPRVAAENVPGAPADIDWDATMAFRHHVWSWGLGVADAMDTAQRNMGLDAKATRELIARSAAEARSAGGALVVGVNTDHVDEEAISLQAVVDAYVEQLHFAEDHGRGHRADGQPAPRPGRDVGGRLRARLPRGARPRGRTGGAALVGRGVRPPARRLLRRCGRAHATSTRSRASWRRTPSGCAASR